MNGALIVERDNAEISAAKLRNGCPEAPAILLMGLLPRRSQHYADAPLLLEVRSLREDLFLEVLKSVTSEIYPESGSHSLGGTGAMTCFSCERRLSLRRLGSRCALRGCDRLTQAIDYLLG